MTELTKYTSLLCLFWLTRFTQATLDDTVLYNINWPGKTIDLKSTGDLQYDEENAIIMKTTNNERYKCMIPTSAKETDANEDGSKNAPSAVDLLAPLFKSKRCAYHLEAYWTYEICHGKHIRQYHEEKAAGGKVKLQEFYLGYFADKVNDASVLDSPTSDDVTANVVDVPSRKIDGVPTPYFMVIMNNGTTCTLKGGEKRLSRVLYVCHPESRNEIMSVTETSSCEYEMVILTPRLCQNPQYKVKGSPVNEIYCTSMDDSPKKPSSLTEEQMNSNMFKSATETNGDEEITEGRSAKDSSKRVEDTGISKHTDEALLKEFLTGDFCLKGGSGWWQYEYCYGKFVRQFHDDKLTGRTVVTVGEWDKEAHMEWAKTTTPRVYGEEIDPETNEKRVRLVQHFYHKGDYCEEVQKPRQVVVKLKCKKSSSSHAVTIYLLEPSVCNYILGIESPIICDLLDTADENGLFVSES